MPKWKLEFILTNGKTVIGIWEGDKNSTDVANQILTGGGNEFIGIMSIDGRHNFLVKREDISVLDISLLENK